MTGATYPHSQPKTLAHAISSVWLWSELHRCSVSLSRNVPKGMAAYHLWHWWYQQYLLHCRNNCHSRYLYFTGDVDDQFTVWGQGKSTMTKPCQSCEMLTWWMGKANSHRRIAQWHNPHLFNRKIHLQNPDNCSTPCHSRCAAEWCSLGLAFGSCVFSEGK